MLEGRVATVYQHLLMYIVVEDGMCPPNYVTVRLQGPPKLKFTVVVGGGQKMTSLKWLMGVLAAGVPGSFSLGDHPLPLFCSDNYPLRYSPPKLLFLLNCDYPRANYWLLHHWWLFLASPCLSCWYPFPCH